MHLSTALAAASLVLQTSAFLVSPHISAKDVAKAQRDADSLFDTQHQVVELECPGCPFVALDGSEVEDTQEIENTIHLEFNISPFQQLQINSAAVFPPDLGISSPLSILAHQTRTSDLSQSPPLVVGYALEVLHVPEDRRASHHRKLFTARFTVLDLNGAPVEVDTVSLTLQEIHRPSGSSLRIVNIESESFEDSPGADACVGSKSWSLCRLRAIVNARIGYMLDAAKARVEKAQGWFRRPGCHGKGPGRDNEPDLPVYDGPREHGHREHQNGRHHHHHHHKHGLHRFGHMLHQTLRFFIVPALLGVIGGLMASAVGMLVGQMIVYTWFRFHRNGQRGTLRLNEEILAVEGENEGLMAGQEEKDGERPPEYVDVVVVDVEEKE